YYICHVEGCFPHETKPENCDADFELHDGVVICDKPVGPISRKLGIHAVISESSGGKSARTHFMRLSYNPVTDTSLVICRLFTGRTHQIRVHVQYLGNFMCNVLFNRNFSCFYSFEFLVEHRAASC
ncbi:unnamed protein product, partial [Trichobilharzia regenti]